MKKLFIYQQRIYPISMMFVAPTKSVYLKSALPPPFLCLDFLSKVGVTARNEVHNLNVTSSQEMF